MSRRFEIDELVAQDSSRVVFEARDRETGARVALRRLLPRGNGGAGLSPEEAQAFEASMLQLQAAKAPGLRRVVGWGVDPIDHLPFHACEWVDGETLKEVLARGVLSVEAGRMLVEAALVVQVALDESGGGWQVATDPGAVLVVGGEQQFWFSFWVEAFPGPSAGSAIEGLAGLVERAMGWQGRLSSVSAGGGLASWVRLVRDERCTAVEALAALRGSPQPTQSAAPKRPSEGPQTDLSWTQPRRRSKIGLWLAATALALLVFSVGVWWIKRGGDDDGASSGLGVAVVAKHGSGPDRAAEASARAAELARQAAGGDIEGFKDTFTPADGVMLRQRLGREVVLEGELVEVRDSNSGKTRYLEFSSSRGLDDVCGRYFAQSGEGLSLGELKPLEGRRVKVTGLVQIETGTGRVVVHLERRAQLEDLGPGA